jgi:hypothetical protein
MIPVLGTSVGFISAERSLVVSVSL